MFVCPECGLSAQQPSHCPQDGAPLLDGRHDPLLGAPVASYRITRLLGRGGMGCVYRAVQPAAGGRVAIKVISTPGDLNAVERFFAEARTLTLVRDEHIVSAIDVGWLPDGRPYIVMEHVEGVTLASLLERSGGLGARQLVGIGLGILEALAAAHAQGIVHRDLKPDNVMVTPAGRAKVLDFGIAKLRREGEPTLGLTATGAILGTPLYMSPEQALARPADARSDLYSFGVILYQGLTGRVPFSGVTFEVLQHHVSTPPTPLRALRPDLPEALEQLVLRTLAKDPAVRPQSAGELRAQLLEIGPSLPDAPPPVLPAAPIAVGFSTHAAGLEVAPGTLGSAGSTSLGTSARPLGDGAGGARTLAWAGVGMIGFFAVFLLVLALAGVGVVIWRHQSLAAAGSRSASSAAPAASAGDLIPQHTGPSPGARARGDPLPLGETSPKPPAQPPNPGNPSSPTTSRSAPNATNPRSPAAEPASDAPAEAAPASDPARGKTITVTEVRPRTVTVSIGNAAVTRGTYDSGALSSGVARGYGPVRSCYLAILEEYDGAAGTINMRMSITPEGTTRGVGWLGTSSSIPTNLGTCINRAYLALPFSPHAGPGSVEATFQIQLSATR